MEQYTELNAYKHLLEVTENILYSLQPDSQILLKYESLKKAVFNKVTSFDLKPQQALNRTYKNASFSGNDKENNSVGEFSIILADSYKKFVHKIL